MQRRIFSFLFILVSLAQQGKCCYSPRQAPLVTDSIPSMFCGNFTDDYEIRYTINDSLWTQHSGIRYHILSWNTAEQYIIAKNDENNPTDKGLYTRIDYMLLKGMEPFTWGFCLSVYDAATDQEAAATVAADRQHPRIGCGGYPFSRMKKIK